MNGIKVRKAYFCFTLYLNIITQQKNLHCILFYAENQKKKKKTKYLLPSLTVAAAF